MYRSSYLQAKFVHEAAIKRPYNQVAKQQVLTIDGNEEILGIAATDETLTVATQSKIFCFNMK